MIETADREDVKYLGRLLGDVIRASEGQAVFDAIEGVRQASVEAHRGGGDAARTALSDRLSALDLGDTLRFVRGFLLFSLLANLAEDRAAAPETRHEATVAGALATLAPEGIDKAQVRALLDHALIAPVLTAHPTEVRRKSMIDRETAIGGLLSACATGSCDPGTEAELVRQITLLWQTRPLRAVRPVVADEIDNAMSTLGANVLPVLPVLHARWEALLGGELPPFLRPGNWIGGDRDGNPNVDATTLKAALARGAQVALGHYLVELNELGAELSISATLAQVSPALAALAEASGDATASRADEPYRRALTGIYARTAASHAALAGRPAPLAARVAAQPYTHVDELLADLETVSASLSANGAGVIAAGRLARLTGAVRIFGFHLATLDLRQNADVHARVVAELLRVAGVAADYEGLDEAARTDLLGDELGQRRLLFIPFAEYSEETAKEMAILRAAAAAHVAYGPECIRAYIISKASGVANLLEVYVLLKEVGLFRPGATPGDVTWNARPAATSARRAAGVQVEADPHPELTANGRGWVARYNLRD